RCSKTKAGRHAWLCMRPNSVLSIRRPVKKCTGKCRCRRTWPRCWIGCGPRLRSDLLMSTEIKWNDMDPESGGRRYLRAAKFAKEWHFSYRLTRRDVRWLPLEPTKAMWEHLLDSLERRYWRREGVSDEDLARVRRGLREWKERLAEDDE